MHRLEIKTLKILEEAGLSGLQHVAVSGGRDSVCLMHALAVLQPRRRWQFKVVHVHHGGSSSYRQAATEHVAREAQRLGLEFMELRSPLAIRPDEASLRRFRMEVLAPLGSVLFAHHAKDLLETRLMRLIRGTGPQGLPSMRIRQGWKIRPWLDIWPSELESYISEKNRVGSRIEWVEDPTNSDPRHLRNWIRGEWLPALQSQRPGSEKRLAASLASLVDEGESKIWTEVVAQSQIARVPLRLLSLADKRRALALYLRQMDVANYGLTHIDEILKRLDTPKKEFSFKCLGRDWIVDAQHIRLGP